MAKGAIEYSNGRVRFNRPSRFLYPSQRLKLEDHFLYGAGAVNSNVPQNWVTTETGAATPYAPSATVVGGALVAVTGGTTNNGEELAGKGVIWQPSTMGTPGPLVLEVRAKFVGTTTAKDGDFYIGFADAVTYTNSLPFVLSAASAFTTSAPVEFCGFGYSSIPSSGAMFNSGGNNFLSVITEKNSVTGTVLPSTTAKDSNYQTYRVEMDASANATFYLNGNKVTSVSAATTAATALTPYIVATAKNSHTQTATIDYIFVSGSYVLPN